MRLTRPQARRMPTKDDRKAHTARRIHRGYREEVRRLAFEADLGPSLKRHLLADPDVVSVEAYPEAFEWTDGLDGRELIHIPPMLVRWRSGATTYVDVMRRDRLVRDPEMGGTRARIEAECLARRAEYEIWTEMEIDRPETWGKAMLEAANGRERFGHATSSRLPPGSGDPFPLLRSVAARCGVDDLREVSGDWIGRDRLTGILVVVLRGARMDPVTRMAIWASIGRAALPRTDRGRSWRKPIAASVRNVGDRPRPMRGTTTGVRSAGAAS